MNQHPFHYRHLVWALLCCVVVWPHAVAAQEGCVRFDGIVHCPVGSAQLQLASDGSKLLATGLGPQGNDGVSSVFEAATQWQAKMRIEGGNEGDEAIFRALADGFLTSSAMFEVHSDGLSLKTAFTGSAGPHTYHVVVLNEGSVVAVFDGLDESSSLDLDRFPIPEPIPWPEWPEWPPWPDFRRLPNGSCAWGFFFGGPTTVTAPSGEQAVGDAVGVIEDLPGGGSYPYPSFTAIAVQTNGSSLVITEEKVSGP